MRISRKVLTMVLIALAFIIAIIGCSKTDTEKADNGSKEKGKSAKLTVSVAASLKDSMNDIKTAYTEGHSNVAVDYNFGSSGSLQNQIEQGADVDVFISAAKKQMDVLKSKGLIVEDTRKDFLKNEVVLIAPKSSSKVKSFEDLKLSEVKKIGIGEPKSVPAGQYAEEVLSKINILSAIKTKFVYGKDVKEVLTWTETGNVDAGLVYETDAKVSNKVQVVAKAPKDSHAPVYYPAAVIKSSKNMDAAKEFINFIYSSEAKPIFERYGFIFMIE